MKDCLVVIPARLGSTRFPGKVLALLRGVPVAERCRRAAAAARVGRVVVATEDESVRRALAPYGAEVVMTSRRCASGSDRVWEAARRQACRVIVNLQGDEPLIRPSTIRKTVALLRAKPWADIATAVAPITDPRAGRDPNVVKVALGADGRCLYFSRADIGPFRHIGIYAYRKGALKRFVALPPSRLERQERLEQLRALEAGMAVAAAVVRDPAVAIDVPSDLRRAARARRGANHG